ncbi:unnamed protein product [Meganyctiphanes norvegica]|uniref:Transmembrane protein 184C n=1 Tax=Meganyctiphanes norvegica TaxID=48144 RepID=A0AAV2Q8W0_MEGNR
MCSGCCSGFCAKWRLWIRPLVFVLYGAVLLGVLPYLTYKLIENKTNKFEIGKYIGGIFVFLAIPITVWEIVQHLINYTKPKLQKHIIRILWMVPVYALNAWIVLLFADKRDSSKPDKLRIALYLDTARECYEAYVIYNFMIFLLNFMDDVMDLDAILETKPQTHHIFPLCCLKPWPMGREFIHRCRHGILQYTVFHLLTTLIAFVCGLAGVYTEGDFRPTNAFVYLFVVNNLSQFVAMYCLVLFYKAMRRELSPMNPLAKFLCIKAVVFFSFFQGVAIMFLVQMDVITTVFDISTSEDRRRVSTVLQDFLICVEMFLAAVAHHYAFSYKPYVDHEYEASGNCCHAFLMMWDTSDVRSDIREHVYVVSEGMKRRLTSRGGSGWSSTTRIPRSEGGDENTRLIAPCAADTHTRYNSTSDSEHDILVEQGEGSEPVDVKAI